MSRASDVALIAEARWLEGSVARVDHKAKELAAELVRRVGTSAAMALVGGRSPGRPQTYVPPELLEAMADLIVVRGLGLYAAARSVMADTPNNVSPEARDSYQRLLVRHFKRHQQERLAHAWKRHETALRRAQSAHESGALWPRISDLSKSLPPITRMQHLRYDGSSIMQKLHDTHIGRVNALLQPILAGQQAYWNRIREALPWLDPTSVDPNTSPAFDRCGLGHLRIDEDLGMFRSLVHEQPLSSVVAVSEAARHHIQSSGILDSIRSAPEIMARYGIDKTPVVLSIGRGEPQLPWTKRSDNKSMAPPSLM